MLHNLHRQLWPVVYALILLLVLLHYCSTPLAAATNNDGNDGTAAGAGGNGLFQKSRTYYHGFYSRQLNSLPDAVMLIFRKQQNKSSSNGIGSTASSASDFLNDDLTSAYVSPLIFSRRQSLPMHKENVVTRYSGAPLANESLVIDIYQGHSYFSYSYHHYTQMQDQGVSAAVLVASLTLPGSDEADPSRSYTIEANLTADGLLIINRTWDYYEDRVLAYDSNYLAQQPQGQAMQPQQPQGQTVQVQMPQMYTTLALSAHPQTPRQSSSSSSSSGRRRRLVQATMPQVGPPLQASTYGSVMRAQMTQMSAIERVKIAVSATHQLSNLDDFFRITPKKPDGGGTTSNPMGGEGKVRYNGVYSSHRSTVSYSFGINHGFHDDNYHKLIDVRYSRDLPLASASTSSWDFMNKDNLTNITVAIYMGESTNASLNYYLGDCQLPLSPIVNTSEKTADKAAKANRTVGISMKVDIKGELKVNMTANKIQKREVKADATATQCFFKLKNIDIPLDEEEEKAEMEEFENVTAVPHVEHEALHVAPNITLEGQMRELQLAARFDQLERKIDANHLSTIHLGLVVISVAVAATIFAHYRFAAKRGRVGYPHDTNAACRYKAAPNGGGVAELAFTNPNWPHHHQAYFAPNGGGDSVLAD